MSREPRAYQQDCDCITGKDGASNLGLASSRYKASRVARGGGRGGPSNEHNLLTQVTSRMNQALAGIGFDGECL